MKTRWGIHPSSNQLTQFNSLSIWSGSLEPDYHGFLWGIVNQTVRVNFWTEYAWSEWDRHAAKYFGHEGD